MKARRTESLAGITLFRELFEEHGIAALVCDPSELCFDGEAWRHAGQPVRTAPHNRLTDFALMPRKTPLSRAADPAGKVGPTPNRAPMPSMPTSAI